MTFYVFFQYMFISEISPRILFQVEREFHVRKSLKCGVDEKQTWKFDKLGTFYSFNCVFQVDLLRLASLAVKL